MNRIPVAILIQVAVSCLLLGCAATGVSPGVDESLAETPEQGDKDDVASGVLQGLDAEMSKRPAIPQSWNGAIKYYTGEYHSLHRVMVHGVNHSTPDDRPPAGGGFYSAFYYDAEGRLRLIVRYPPDQQPYVSDHIVYHASNPVARICYSRESLSYGDFISYVDGKPFLSYRENNGGSIGLVKILSGD